MIINHIASDETDETLFQRVLAGDEQALEPLVQRYHSPLVSFAYRQTGDYYLAEDLVQDTFTRIVAYNGQLPRRFRAWAFTIANNLIRDHFRSGYYRRERVPSDQDAAAWGCACPYEQPGSDEHARRDDDTQAVHSALQQLPVNQREVLILRFYHDLKLDEIATITGIPMGTVKSRLFHALQRMKIYLQGHNDSLEWQPHFQRDES